MTRVSKIKNIRVMRNILIIQILVYNLKVMTPLYHG